MANFFFDPEHSNEIDLVVSSQNKDELEEFLRNSEVFEDEEGRQYIQIDCMRFLVDDIRIRGFTGRRWTNGEVFYVFDGNVSSVNKDKFRAAAQVWSRVASLTFRETASTNYIHVKDDPGNWSYVGMISGRQEMGIYNWGWKYIIAHEIGHALGLSHEQSRSDRDTYVKILTQNIVSGAERNFAKRNTVNYSVYDFCSIMHYGQYAFSKNNLPTIEAQPGYESEEACMGNRGYLTDLDAVGMAARYGARSFTS